MAKKSSVEKNARRRKMAKSWSGRRSRLKAIVGDKKKPMEELFAASLKLAQLPRNSSATPISRSAADHQVPTHSAATATSIRHKGSARGIQASSQR